MIKIPSGYHHQSLNVHNSIIDKARVFCRNLLKKDIPAHLTFHNLAHTTQVVAATEMLGRSARLSEEDLEVVILAAWFHDTGFCVTCANHEAVSSGMASSFLKLNGYGPDEIRKVVGCILATKLPQTPENILQQILCDADLAHLARPFYWVKNARLRKELEAGLDRPFSDLQWYTCNMDFLLGHQYFTQFGKTEFASSKKVNIEANRRLIQKIQASLDRTHAQKTRFQGAFRH